MAKSNSDYMKERDKEIKAQNPSIKDFNYDETCTPATISKFIGEKNVESRAQSALAGIKSVLKLIKGEKSGPITQPNTDSHTMEETEEKVTNSLEIVDMTVAPEVSNSKENNEPSKDDEER